MISTVLEKLRELNEEKKILIQEIKLAEYHHDVQGQLNAMHKFLNLQKEIKELFGRTEEQILFDLKKERNGFYRDNAEHKNDNDHQKEE